MALRVLFRRQARIGHKDISTKGTPKEFSREKGQLNIIKGKSKQNEGKLKQLHRITHREKAKHVHQKYVNMLSRRIHRSAKEDTPDPAGPSTQKQRF